MLNYAVIIQYLTQQLNIPNVRIAEWLNLDPSIISNIKNNKRKMQKTFPMMFFTETSFAKPKSELIFKVFTAFTHTFRTRTARMK